jgi:hypothetical protein
MSTETELYTAKENAKSTLLSALQAYITAAEANGMDDPEQSGELEDLLAGAGKTWDVLPQ